MKKYFSYLFLSLILISCETNDVIANLGCTDPIACNYDAEAFDDDGSCTYANECIDCDGVVIDSDQDGVGDCDEVAGCTDSLACNYNPSVSDDDGSCEYALEGFDCEGNSVVDMLIINEVLYDPPAGDAGDVNTDGVREANDDEFVELVNGSSSPIDLSGYMFFDADDMGGTPAHIVPENTILLPGKAFVLFGGGDASSFSSDFGGALVQVCSNKPINLNNSGDFLTIQDAQGNTVLEFDVEPLSDNPDESYTRYPDVTGDFVQHASVVDGVLYSAGTRVDGTSF